MRTLLIFVLLATTTYAHAEIKAWKNYFSGSINYQTSEFTLTFKKGEDSNRIIVDLVFSKNTGLVTTRI